MSNKFHTPLLSNDPSFISDRFFKSHSHNLPSWLLLLLVGIFSCVLPSIPLAQSAPLTNPASIAEQEQLRQQERERVQRQQQEVRPDVRLGGSKLSGLYDEQGNIRREMSNTTRKVYDYVVTPSALVPSTPFAAAELLSPEMWNAISILLKGAK